jgi:hypothetical protein
VKKTEDKNGKKDSKGNVIVYTNVNFKAASKVPTIEDDNGNDVKLKVAPLVQPARCIQFDNATKEDVQFIRANLRKQIKLAANYAGSAMQKAIEAYEAEQDAKSDKTEPDDDTPAHPEEKTKPKNNPKPVAKEDQGDDSPF